MRLKLDENLGVSAKAALTSAGFEAETVRDEELEMQLDQAEKTLRALSKDTAHKDSFNATRFFLERRGAHRGWGAKAALEISGKDGGPIDVRDRMEELRTKDARSLAALAGDLTRGGDDEAT